jgi:hypothetical protein
MPGSRNVGPGCCRDLWDDAGQFGAIVAWGVGRAGQDALFRLLAKDVGGHQLEGPFDVGRAGGEDRERARIDRLVHIIACLARGLSSKGLNFLVFRLSLPNATDPPLPPLPTSLQHITLSFDCDDAPSLFTNLVAASAATLRSVHFYNCYGDHFPSPIFLALNQVAARLTELVVWDTSLMAHANLRHLFLASATALRRLDIVHHCIGMQELLSDIVALPALEHLRLRFDLDHLYAYHSFLHGDAAGLHGFTLPGILNCMTGISTLESLTLPVELVRGRWPRAWPADEVAALRAAAETTGTIIVFGASDALLSVVSVLSLVFKLHPFLQWKGGRAPVD